MAYYIFDEVSPNRDAPYLDLPDEIDMIDSIMGKKPDFYELPIQIPAKITAGEKIVYTDIINPGVPLFSNKMKEALEQFGIDNIDYYPVELIDAETKEVLAEYWLAIVKSIVACLDTDKSQFMESSSAGGRMVIMTFSIDQSKTTGLDLFRFHNIPGLVIISEALKDKLSTLEFKGVSFRNTSEYHREK